VSSLSLFTSDNSLFSAPSRSHYDGSSLPWKIHCPIPVPLLRLIFFPRPFQPWTNFSTSLLFSKTGRKEPPSMSNVFFNPAECYSSQPPYTREQFSNPRTKFKSFINSEPNRFPLPSFLSNKLLRPPLLLKDLDFPRPSDEKKPGPPSARLPLYRGRRLRSSFPFLNFFRVLIPPCFRTPPPLPKAKTVTSNSSIIFCKNIAFFFLPVNQSLILVLLSPFALNVPFLPLFAGEIETSLRKFAGDFFYVFLLHLPMPENLFSLPTLTGSVDV